MPELNAFFLRKIFQDSKTTNGRTENTKQNTEKTKEILSPKTIKKIKRNISNDNFMKFSWSWTL